MKYIKINNLWKGFLALLVLAGSYTAGNMSLAVSRNLYSSNAGTGTSCTISVPCSFSTAIGQAQAGDIINVVGVMSPITISKSGTASSPITIRGGIFDGINSSANEVIMVSGSYITIENVEIKNGWNFGIRVTGDRVTIKDSSIHDNVRKYWNGSACTGAGSWGSGVRFGPESEYATLENSTVYNNCGEGIGTVGSAYTLIKNNIAYDSYSMVIYIDEGRNVRVEGNTVYCSNPAYYKSGIVSRGISYGDEGNAAVGYTQADIINNTVNGCRGVAFYNKYGTGKVINSSITGNVFDPQFAAVSIPSGSLSNVIVSNNVGNGFSAPGATLSANYTATPLGITPTPSFTPTVTFTPTITQTATITPIPSGSETSTMTPSPSATVTATPTKTTTPSPTITPTPRCYIYYPEAGVQVTVCFY